MPTTCDRFRAAAQCLVGAAPVKLRLAEAYRDHLAGLSEPDLPRELRKDYQTLRDSMTRMPPVGGLGSIDASVRKLSDAQAVELATRILGMYAVVAESTAQSARPPALRAVNFADG